MKERGTHYDRRKMTIEVDEGNGQYYQIDCERLDGSAEVLDFILQIAGKQWCRASILADLLRCLDEACEDRFGRRAQGVFCSFGVDHKVDWKKKTSDPKR